MFHLFPSFFSFLLHCYVYCIYLLLVRYKRYGYRYLVSTRSQLSVNHLCIPYIMHVFYHTNGYVDVSGTDSIISIFVIPSCSKVHCNGSSFIYPNFHFKSPNFLTISLTFPLHNSSLFYHTNINA